VVVVTVVVVTLQKGITGKLVSFSKGRLTDISVFSDGASTIVGWPDILVSGVSEAKARNKGKRFQILHLRGGTAISIEYSELIYS